MKEIRHRMAAWWIHWEDLNWPDHDNLDEIRRRAASFAEANVTAAVIFGTHFRWDWLPFFPLLHDYLATVSEELHRYGIRLFDHHSVNLVHRYSTREEMRHVMTHSGPHLPFCPTWEAAATWEYKGKRLNDWRMIDVKNGKPLYFPQYAGEGFCFNNPDFQEAYFDYVKGLISDTGIIGLGADDAMFYMHYNACGCEVCRAKLKERTGMDLPSADRADFWGNWDNPAWRAWVDLRFEGSAEFYRKLRARLPEDFVLFGCGGSSASAGSVMSASDARGFLKGANYVNMEIVGNIPPYKNDPLTTNTPLPNRIVHASHHQAAAREAGVRAFCTGYAHSAESANHAWALAKMLDADIWLGTLKKRLGLPRHVLDTLPTDADVVKEAFTFEKEQSQLFAGKMVGSLGVYFSYETRNHTLYGNLIKGYPKDYSSVLKLLFSEGICPHTVFSFPADAETYPLILLCGALSMTEEEKRALKTYLKAGGKVVAIGPCALEECEHHYSIPNRVDYRDPAEFFTSVPDGIHVKMPDWVKRDYDFSNTDSDQWHEPLPGLFYHPYRLGDENRRKLLELCRLYAKPQTVKIRAAKGFMCTTSESEDLTVLQFLAEDYHVDVDHALDDNRFHRSRVSVLAAIEPAGTDGILKLEGEGSPTVYTPFVAGEAKILREGTCVTVTLPDKCSYAIVTFPKKR